MLSGLQALGLKLDLVVVYFTSGEAELELRKTIRIYYALESWAAVRCRWWAEKRSSLTSISIDSARAIYKRSQGRHAFFKIGGL